MKTIKIPVFQPLSVLETREYSGEDSEPRQNDSQEIFESPPPGFFSQGREIITDPNYLIQSLINTQKAITEEEDSMVRQKNPLGCKRAKMWLERDPESQKAF